MPKISPAKSFDYSSLDAETNQFVQQQTGEIRMLMKRTAQGIIEIGQKLIEVKKRLGHGRFLDWLEAEFEWTERTARNFMRVAEVFKSENFSDLQLAPSALYLLASPSIPEVVREEALERASTGESITYKTAKEIKHKYTSPSTQTREVRSSEAIGRTGDRGQKTKEQFSRAPSESPDPLVIPSAQPRHRARQAERQGPEILAIRPNEALQSPTVPSAQTRARTKPSFPETQLVQPGSWWQLEQKHLLYCGSPSSPRFQERLPGQVALSLAFPPSQIDWPHTLSPQIKSALSLFTIYQDQDLTSFRGLVRASLELYTEGEEIVVFSFLPDPELLMLAHKLGCRCFVAEPEPARCDAALATWQQTGAKCQRLSGLRF